MLLINPPVTKPCEPPAGIAQLAAALRAHGIACTVLDGNLEGLLFLLEQPFTASDTWTRRALKNRARNLAALRDPGTYRSPDRYRRAVLEVNRALEAAGAAGRAIIGLADYHDRSWSPLRSADLIAAAEHPEQNPFHPWFSERLPEALGVQARRGSSLTGAAPMAGFSLNFLGQALTAFGMIGFIRKEFPRVKIVLGGGLVTSWMRQPGWRNPFSGLVDHVIAGPGEGPLLDLLGVIERQQEHAAPEFGDTPLHDYLAPGFILPYSGSSGCSWRRCTFCPERAENNPYLPVPAVRAAAEIRALAGKLRPVLLHLLDSEISPALMHALVQDPPGVPWYGFARITSELADLEHCFALKRAGCAMLKLGLESGDQGVLDALRKGVDLSTASTVLQNLNKAGIAAYVYLLFGTPAESAAEARRTLEFIARHQSAIEFLNLAVFNMPRAGAEAAQYGTGPFYEGDLALYTDFDHPRGWDRKQVRLFLENEFKRHPAIAAIARNEPPLFTSNHAVFFAHSTHL